LNDKNLLPLCVLDRYRLKILIVKKKTPAKENAGPFTIRIVSTAIFSQLH